MRIGGKEIENINTFDLDNSHDEDKSTNFDIKDYITKLMKTNTIINECTFKEDHTINNEDNKQNKDSDCIFPILKPEETQSHDEIDIETKKIDFNRNEIEKANKSLINKTSKYLINKKYQLYKTEICRSHSEVGFCKYGTKCQFAHDISELRDVMRHPRYKTETCRTFWEEGSCPYGKRCCFIHVPKTTNDVFNEKTSSEIIMKSITIIDKNNQKDDLISKTRDLTSSPSNNENFTKR
ncbi:Tristetraproline [Nosema bombycis CQ1]|uniref:Tristetraproline n=1 Tax=Nosema bombycis (strain CQ1 / CVCC 102059) TaxID=578461 RepID=R0MGX2_NOSB1|nr:Tristetraproline [Nosema bombycis CQ1]|eukprot:EOB12033.1 Tristetraproline [Nosema bombycis CQ1]